MSNYHANLATLTSFSVHPVGIIIFAVFLLVTLVVRLSYGVLAKT